ncbi:hypothetical protein H8356DRAFT_1353281 [Neocallimastix lanati (nom. inval.)]|jgi:hypothetical protein|uniref:EF-hand domain-containing protein n=1 Tax=Neocallimastix californiae TaxID=1754190 RepID=A0A1Y1ZA97_9FUNG|nr:hypothetical protein H8356DRAFT_1353281 [Neocallimastix sp. JGI-2020a]ORY07179.1 hypothetical protein LY90DRAFT_519138 [Neocallimastix californiae]|eukprot:ORY07179.1 hypothetical protein LY90DRAFT_519138 [Neocallimastix californiae]
MYQNQQGGYPPQGSYPPPQGQQQSYPPPQGYPQQQQGGYPQQQGGYPPQQQGSYYGYPPQGSYYGGYPQQGYQPYGAPAYGYAAPAYGYAAPAYGYGQYMHPQSYTKAQYNYTNPYSATSAYVVPTNVSPQQAQKMITASNAFRYFDKDHSGTLSQAEWAHCMSYLGVNIPQSEMNRLYYMIDTDRSGTINEREFCEWFSSCY